MTSDDDDDLVAGLRTGDEATYVMLTRLHSRAMLRIAEFYVASRATAEDVVQDTWVAILKGVGDFEQRCSLKTWMFGILANQARTAGRRERRCVPNASIALRAIEGYGSGISADQFLDGRHPQWPLHWKQPPMAWECVAEDRLVAAEDVRIVQTAIKDLPQTQRLVISLRDVHCWTATEVCDLLGVTASNQRVLLHRARSTVRQCLDDFHRDDTSHEFVGE